MEEKGHGIQAAVRTVRGGELEIIPAPEVHAERESLAGDRERLQTEVNVLRRERDRLASEVTALKAQRHDDPFGEVGAEANARLSVLRADRDRLSEELVDLRDRLERTMPRRGSISFRLFLWWCGRTTIAFAITK